MNLFGAYVHKRIIALIVLAIVNYATYTLGLPFGEAAIGLNTVGLPYIIGQSIYDKLKQLIGYGLFDLIKKLLGKS